MPTSFTLGESWYPPPLGGERRRPSRAQLPICKANWRRPTVNCVTHASRSLFKKNIGHSLRTVLERYERINAMKNEHAVLRLCQELEVSASGYYDWQFRRSCPGLRAAQDQTLKQEIQSIHTTSRNTYGSPRIVMELRKSGARHGRNRVARLMSVLFV